MNYHSSPAWTIKGKYQSSSPPASPCPTSYCPQDLLTTSKDPTWKIGTDSKIKIYDVKDTPGPGRYDSKGPQRSKQYGKFGKQNQSDTHSRREKTLSPGPGQYKILLRPSSPSISFAKKYESVNKNAGLPGPGAYNSKPIKKVPTICFGKQRRFVTSKQPQNIPGPGTYEYRRPSSAKIAFTRDERCTQTMHCTTAPGPGNYTVASEFQIAKKSMKGFSIKGKENVHASDSVPGPGWYNPSSIQYQSSPMFTMAKKYSPQKTDAIPAANRYSPQAKTQSIYYSIGKSQRQPLYEKKEVPGPGNYLNVSTHQSGPKYSLGMSRKFQPPSLNPGPGMYCPNKDFIKRRPQSAKIGTSKRSNQVSSTIPGPGTYENSPMYNPGKSIYKFAYTKEERLKSKIDELPGPGQYQLASLISNLPAYVK